MAGRFLHRILFGVSVAAFAGAASQAYAQKSADAYPTQLVRIVVPVLAGSNSDTLARALADKLGQMWPQQIIVENRPGLAGIGSVAKSPADGHTILLNSNGHTIINNISANLPFDPIKDFVGVTHVASMPLIVTVPPDSPAKTLKELIALAQANPGKLNYASPGLGTTTNIATVLFMHIAKVDMQHVPYKGTPDAQTSVMRGDTAMFFAPSAVGQDLIQSGKLRALAVSGTKRLDSLPDVPTFAEAGLPEFVYDAWFGMLAPTGTPPAVLQKISSDIGKVLQMPDIQKRFASQGVDTVWSTPERFDAVVKADTARFGELFSKAQKK